LRTSTAPRRTSHWRPSLYTTCVKLFPHIREQFRRHGQVGGQTRASRMSAAARQAVARRADAAGDRAPSRLTCIVTRTRWSAGSVATCWTRGASFTAAWSTSPAFGTSSRGSLTLHTHGILPYRGRPSSRPRRERAARLPWLPHPGSRLPAGTV
jgi:hypothetical protein